MEHDVPKARHDGNRVGEAPGKSVELLDLLKSEDLNKKMNVLKDEAANTLKELLQQLIDSKKQTVLATANLPVNTPISLSQT